LNRLAHKVIVDLTAPFVYTVRSGRLQQIGVHKLIITSWEANESRPAVHSIQAIIRFLGSNLWLCLAKIPSGPNTLCFL
jgi:hypothetical protein